MEGAARILDLQGRVAGEMAWDARHGRAVRRQLLGHHHQTFGHGLDRRQTADDGAQALVRVGDALDEGIGVGCQGRAGRGQVVGKTLRQQAHARHVAPDLVVQLACHVPALLHLTLRQAPLEFATFAEIVQYADKMSAVIDLPDRQCEWKRRARCDTAPA